MFNGKRTLSSQYYYFSISNLVAAFGGGLILGKGAGVIVYPYLQGGSILAFFIGTLLGLIFLQFIPERISKLLANFFSIGGSLASLLLFYVYQNYAKHDKINGSIALFFFILLSIRFGFWFYSRVVRASKAADFQHSIAWVEFGYYFGMVLGLIFWKFLGVSIVFGAALIMDAICQLIAGVLDLYSFRLEKTTLSLSNTDVQIVVEPDDLNYSSLWCWKLASAVICMTIGVQVTIFNSAHEVADVGGSYILAIFYFGVAVAAFMCNKYKMYILWGQGNNLATIMAKSGHKTFQCNLLALIGIIVTAVVIVIYQIYLRAVMLDKPAFFNDILIYSLVFVAAFIYEVLAISLLDRIGYEEKKLKMSGMIMRTYGLMGLGAAISFWILGLLHDHFTTSIVILSLCSLATLSSILKRDTMVSAYSSDSP